MTDTDTVVSNDLMSLMELGAHEQVREVAVSPARIRVKSSSNSRIVTNFTERQQELEVVVRRVSSGALIDPADASKFSLELLSFHTVATAIVASHFHSSAINGLLRQNVLRNSQQYGSHVIPKVVEAPVWKRLFYCFFSGFSPLLWLACFLVFLSWRPFGTPPSNIYNLALAIALLIVIFLSGIFTFSQEMQTASVLSSFSNLVPPECMVIRDGNVTTISVEDIVVGDLLVLSTGVRVPADCRLVSTANLKLDKSILTGECDPVRVTDGVISADINMLEATNMAFMGCTVVEGSGTGLVIATGSRCQLATIAAQANATSSPLTTLQLEINRLAVIVAGIAVVITTVAVLQWVLYIRVQHSSFMTLSSMIANAIGILVAFIPEGLPLALTMGLTIIASRLCATYFVFVKQLGTIETVGSVSFLASDKTGTLTQNKMSVTALVVCQEVPKLVPDLDMSSTSTSTWNEQSSSILRAAVLCNQAKLEIKDGETVPVPVVVSSNGVDKALMEFGVRHNGVEQFQSGYVEKALVPFSSATKFTAVVVRPAASPHAAASFGSNKAVVVVKGAYEYVLDRCDTYMDATGCVRAISNEFLDDVNSALDPALSAGHRVVVVAQRVLSESTYPPLFEYSIDPIPNFPITGLTFLACFVISDPPREGVKQAVTELRGAGIKIAMVTGDSAVTATAIARNVGIVTASHADKLADIHRPRRIPSAVEMAAEVDHSSVSSTKSREEAIVVEGRELDAIEPVQWDFIFAHSELVFARTTPAQKLQIVKQCQLRGHRVGVTGDGVNDSPALKCADVGIAMQSGSDVARDAADIVLLKDDFNAIVQSVREGRLIFINLRKVVAYQMSAGCWGEVLPVLATFFLGLPQPLSSFLMIVISCVSDVFAGIALTREVAETAIMRDRPRDLVRNRLVDFNLFLYSYMFYGNLISIGCFFCYFHYMAGRGNTRDLSNPIPADDDGSRVFPIGYRASQLIGAWNWGANGNNLGLDEAAAYSVGTSVYYVVVVVCQMGHLLSIRKKSPYFYEAFQKVRSGEPVDWFQEVRSNLPTVYIVMAWMGAVAAAVFFTETAAIHVSCQTASVPPKYWGMAFGWSALFFVIGELRKWSIIAFPNSIGKLAW